MTNTTQNDSKIGKFLRFATDDPVFIVWVGLGEMMFSIVLFGLHDQWWYLLMLPAGVLALAVGVARQEID